MRNIIRKRPILLTGFALSSVVFCLPVEASSFTGINIFGDSLVETGNLFNVTGAFPPSPPYFQGRLSNEEIWIDTLADNLNLNPILSSQLGTTVPFQGVNFAFSGATTGSSNVGGAPLPGLQQQIDAFINLTAIVPTDEDALFVLWAGSNDYNEAFFNPSSLTVPITELPEQVTGNLSSALQSLYGVGARNFLVVNLPDLGETPFAGVLDEFSPGAAEGLNNLTTTHNFLLDRKLNDLKTSFSDINLITLDTNSLFNDIITEPSRFGFTDVDNSCLVNFQSGFVFDDVCDNPDEFVFWDNVHPTGATHQLIAGVAIDTLEENALEEQKQVPEPSNILSFFLASVSAFSLISRSKNPSVRKN